MQDISCAAPRRRGGASHRYLTEPTYADLWRDDWLAVVSESNPTVGDVRTVDDIATLPWVTNRLGIMRPRRRRSADRSPSSGW